MTGAPPRRRAPLSASALALVLVATLGAGPASEPIELGREARQLEEIGAYAKAAETLRALRRRVPADADLELALALNDARSHREDSALVRLASPILDAAAVDSLPVARRREYPWEREAYWVTGRYEGWHWYVWRARAELQARRGDWGAARESARRCVEARPLSGLEWVVLSVCAGRAGDPVEAAAAAERALKLAPNLPESHYLAGLWSWRAGRRAEARGRMLRAQQLDSTWREPTLAVTRLRLPGAVADPLPTTFFHGIRETALIGSPAQPKLEEFDQLETDLKLVRRVDPKDTGTAKPGGKPTQLLVSVLIDARGRIVLADLPWFTSQQLSEERVAQVLATLPEWEFVPATKHGEPRATWSSLEFLFQPE